MPAYYILKSEPTVYPFAQFLKDRRTVWDGIANPQALIYLRGMKPGDRALIYHSNVGKALVGLAIITSAAYPDPKLDDEKRVVVDVEADRALPTEVTLAAIKADPAFKDLGLVRHSRLSVVPVPAAMWKRLLKMGGVKG
jgi:predicted RNA-binding protein with PUA-like domain